MLNPPPYPSDSFDVIVSFETIEHLPNPEKYLSAVSKMLKADGAFIVSTPVRTKGRLTDKPANPFHVREWNADEFSDLITSYFSDVRVLGQSFHFLKTWLPGNRTLISLVCRAFYPAEFSKLFQTEVTISPRLPRLFQCSAAYQIAVCRTPVRQQS